MNPLNIAYKEIGYSKSGKNNKYVKWLKSEQYKYWDTAFVSWCMNKSDIPSQYKFKSYYAGLYSQMFIDIGRGRAINSFTRFMYVPKRDDIVFYTDSSKQLRTCFALSVSYKNNLIDKIRVLGENNGKVKIFNVSIYNVKGYGLVADYLNEKNSGKTNASYNSSALKLMGVASGTNAVAITFSEKKGYTYSIYVDNSIKEKNISFQADATITRTYSGISSGKRTIKVAAYKNGKIVNSQSKTVTVKGTPVKTTPSGGASYSGGGSSGANSNSSSSSSGKEELAYLKEFLKTLKKNKKKKTTLNYEISKINYSHKVEIQMLVQNGKKLFSPPVIDGLRVIWERKGTAGKMTFQTIPSSKYKIVEGNPIALRINGKKFFYGFVFTVQSSKDKKLDVTVYDQLRYLKAKDTYVYKKLPTNKLIKAIAGNMGMNIGVLDKTKHLVTRAEDNVTLFDMISNSLNETLISTGKIYTLYDNFGKLMLKKPSEMKITNCLIDSDTAQNYNYSRSIDDGVYNQIKLAYTNDKGKTKFYYTKSKKNIAKWGTLQYFEKIDYPKLAKTKGEVLLTLYNKVAKTVKITGCFGNSKVRAGCLIPVLLNFQDGSKISSFMIVDKVTHYINNGAHTMDLDVSGGDFDSAG